jgi:hypothetical protein
MGENGKPISWGRQRDCRGIVFVTPFATENLFWILDCGILNRQDAKNAKNSFWISDFGFVSDLFPSWLRSEKSSWRSWRLGG